MKIKVEQVVDATPQQVFAVLADFRTYLRTWAKGVLSVTGPAIGQTTVGSVFDIRGRNVGLTGDVNWRYEVTEHDAPFRFGGRATGGPVPFLETFVLTPSSTGTTIGLLQELQPRGQFRLFGPLLSKAWSHLLAQNLKRLAMVVQKGS